ncbi:unnamed protein product [Medioppia subpectinata]|uniref:Caprin-1 dimerization domain-containing protein n=1 Tax=Medioppia subpectinata TaxID=1979941 RepID=A0A7R9PZY8_9ACAR|nr:unnamed protein product [Medioppia subpectinata]CAG2106975.1 unnamed protein product [Medioppia subpectinata]
MPTANKDTKTSTTAQAAQEEPQKLVQNLVDKKIRNLEKRKARLQELREMQEKGQELEPEQQLAVKKLDQVQEIIDHMKDLNKSISEVLVENTKQQKKLAKKEMLEKSIERQQQEVERLKNIVKFQDILSRFETKVRRDFAKGTNGAIKLSDDQLSQLDKLYAEVCEVSDSKIDTIVEKLISLSDGKSREAWSGVSYHQLKELLTNIIASKYFETKETVIPTPTATTITTKTTTDDLNANTNTQISSNQFHINDFNPSLTQIQSQFASGISFMNPLVEKDPAVLAVSGDSNYPYPPYNSINSNAIPDSNNAIPTQTFTNQKFAPIMTSAGGHQPAGHVFPPASVAVPIAALIQPDMVSGMTPDMTFVNQQTFMNAADKHQNTSQDRHNNFNSDDNYKNNRNRGNRSENPRKPTNGYGNREGNRGRNTSKEESLAEKRRQIEANPCHSEHMKSYRYVCCL